MLIKRHEKVCKGFQNIFQNVFSIAIEFSIIYIMSSPLRDPIEKHRSYYAILFSLLEREQLDYGKQHHL